jgi:hypothetical protein
MNLTYNVNIYTFFWKWIKILSLTKFKVVLISDSQLIYWYNLPIYHLRIGTNKLKFNVTRTILIFYNDQCLVFIGKIITLMNYDNVQVNYMQSN